MQLSIHLIGLVFLNTLVASTSSARIRSLKGLKPEAGASVNYKDTCDKLANNFCFYSVVANETWAATSIVDWNCQGYGEDQFLFNVSTAFLTSGPQPVLDHVWTISNLTRLNAPQSSITIPSPGTVPTLKWLGKTYTVTPLTLRFWNTVKQSFSDKPVTYRIQVPC